MQPNSQTNPDFGQFEFQKWPVYIHAVDFSRNAYLLCRDLKK